LVNFSNNTKKNESKLNFGRNSINNHSNNRLFIGKTKSENSYSDMMFRKENNIPGNNPNNNINNNNNEVNYSQTQKKLFFNNKINKK